MLTLTLRALALALYSSFARAQNGVFPLHPEDGAPRSFWRLPCRGQSGVGRIDPIMSPGRVSSHVHVVYGASGFGTNASSKTLQRSDCTSCAVTQDRSAYWTPTLNFVHPNGTTVMVEQAGGLLVYYKSFADTRPFPEGFRMVAGDPFIRDFTGPFPDVETSNADVWTQDPAVVGDPDHQILLMQRALGFNCLHYGQAAEPSLFRHVLPTKAEMDTKCVDGLRLELAFPSCGTGAIDADDHRAHMAYPSLVKQGVCPQEFPILFPLLFFETIYDTYAFRHVPGTFVLSHGDPVGTGYHGDFMMGWESQAMLGRAMDECRSMLGEVTECPVFNLQTDEDQKSCRFPVPNDLRSEDAVGPREGLAGGVPIQSGPAPATAWGVQS